jgi:DNA modification methylase
MPTYLRLTNANPRPLPPEFQGDDVRFTESLVEHFLDEFTRPGDVVIDPFAGYGTTLLAAEGRGRAGYGIEYEERRVRYVQGLLQHPERLIHGDARRLAEYDLPPVDLCFTSPPYTNRSDPEDPFTNYSQKGTGYAAYLDEMDLIFAQVAGLLKPSGRAVIEVANLKDASGVTPLAWDVAAAVSRILRFEGEIVVCWDRYGYGYDHSYCLVFSKA